MKKTLNDLLTKKIRSKYSGTVEITWLNGKKVLNSENANYSYGALETVLDAGLSCASADRAAEILVLGLGGGSVVHLLRNKFTYHGKITAVEIDPAIIEIAETEFNIKDHAPIEIVCGDAGNYIEQNSAQFGLIIIDVFIDLQVPPEFYSTPFWKHISRSLEDHGVVLFNAGISSGNLKGADLPVKEIPDEIHLKNFNAGANILLLGTRKARS